jgi:hypothetical protein
VLDQARAAELLSDEHLRVDGTVIEAWASQQSFQKDRAALPTDDPGSPTVEFHGEKRSNETHESKTDPEARLPRKSGGHESKLLLRQHADREPKRAGSGHRIPEYQRILISAAAVIVPGLVLTEVDYFLHQDRAATRKLIAEISDPATRYEYEWPTPGVIARARKLDRKFAELGLGLVGGTVAAVAERRQVYRLLDHGPVGLQCDPDRPPLRPRLELLP